MNEIWRRRRRAALSSLDHWITGSEGEVVFCWKKEEEGEGLSRGRGRQMDFFTNEWGRRGSLCAWISGSLDRRRGRGFLTDERRRSLPVLGSGSLDQWIRGKLVCLPKEREEGGRKGGSVDQWIRGELGKIEKGRSGVSWISGSLDQGRVRRREKKESTTLRGTSPLLLFHFYSLSS